MVLEHDLLEETPIRRGGEGEGEGRAGGEGSTILRGSCVSIVIIAGWLNGTLKK